MFTSFVNADGGGPSQGRLVTMALIRQGRRLQARLEAALLSEFELTYDQYELLLVVEALERSMPGFNMRDVADQQTLESDTSRMIRRLVKRGYLTKSQDPEDGRAKNVRLSRVGKAVLVRVSELLDPICEELQRELGSAAQAGRAYAAELVEAGVA